MVDSHWAMPFQLMPLEPEEAGAAELDDPILELLELDPVEPDPVEPDPLDPDPELEPVELLLEELWVG